MVNQIPDNQIPDTSAGPLAERTVRIAVYDDYRDAQRAVDHLSDSKFPVSTVSIVWTGLRHVEVVTGRRTVLTAAFGGALAGAWFGSLLGLLLTLFVDTADGTSALAVVATYALIAAVAGAIWQAGSHAFLRGRRDFETQGRLDAERFELWTQPSTANLAMELLGIGTIRPEDPQPTEDPTRSTEQ